MSAKMGRLPRHVRACSRSVTWLKQSYVSLSRRRLLAGASLTAAVGFLGGASMAPVMAKAPMQNTQAPAFYRFKVGGIEATVVSDGPLPMGPPKPDIFIGCRRRSSARSSATTSCRLTMSRSSRMRSSSTPGEPRGRCSTPAWGTDRMLGPDTGRLVANLAAAGVEPKDVDAVVLTHAHPDHCFALMRDDGARTFPNAQIYMAQADFDFWTDEGKLANDMLKGFIAGARKHLVPNRDRMVFVRDGQEFLPGVQAMSAPGKRSAMPSK